MFSFGKNKTEARITGEFYTNAIHVMEGASLLAEGEVAPARCPQCGAGMDPASFKVFTNYVALPAAGSLPHRILGAGRGQDPPPASGERTEPARRAGRWRRQRNWPRSGAAGRGARRARDGRRPRRRRRSRALQTELASHHIGGIHLRHGVDIRNRDAIRDALDAPSRPLAASTSSSTPLRCFRLRPTA